MVVYFSLISQYKKTSKSIQKNAQNRNQNTYLPDGYVLEGIYFRFELYYFRFNPLLTIVEKSQKSALKPCLKQYFHRISTFEVYEIFVHLFYFINNSDFTDWCSVFSAIF